MRINLSNTSNQGKLYSRFISILKFLQIIGYIVVFIVGISLGYINFVGRIFIVVVGSFSVYISTQGFIAIIDILSHIEDNTRHLKDFKEETNLLAVIDTNIANILDSLESIENKL